MGAAKGNSGEEHVLPPGPPVGPHDAIYSDPPAISKPEEPADEKRLGDPRTEKERFDRTLFATVDALTEAGIPYAMIGGVATRRLGRPRVTHDIDIFVKPDDADRSLEALGAHGFRTQRTDPHWLYKAWKEDVLVDIVFKSTGDIYFDEDIQSRTRIVPYKGRELRAVSAEDFVIIKSAVHREDGPHHWYDALAVLTHGDLDWEYLLRRARHAPRRVLALLVYAQSNDIQIPNRVVRQLFEALYEPMSAVPRVVSLEKERAEREVAREGDRHERKEEPRAYVAGRIRQAISQDRRTGAADVRIIVGDRRVTIKGEVASAEQARAVEEVVRAQVSGWHVESHLDVRSFPGPEGAEAV